MSQQPQTSTRGFASMDEDRQRDIASKGGQSMPAGQRSFSKDHALAAEAGRKGGEANQGGGNQPQGQEGGSRGNFASDRERAARAGSKGGSR